MPLIEDPLLIVKADFQIYRDTSDNMDNVRMEQGIREAQVNEMLQFLGAELYLLLINDYTELSDNFTEQIYTDLWFGADYTSAGKEIRFHGLKPAITLYAYARMLDNIQLNVTRTGAVTFIDDEASDPTVQAQIVTKVKSARSQALIYIAQAYKFIKDNKSDYPAYFTKESEITNKTSFQFFKV